MFRVLLACVILVIALPVGAAPRLKDSPVAIYYPTTVGDRWVTETKPSADATDVSGTVTEVVTAIEKKDGVMIVTVCREIDGKQQDAKSQMKITDQGLFRMSTYGTVFDEPYHVLKMPLKVGQAWTTEVRSGAATTFKYKVVKEEEIQVPAGKFKTFRLDVELDSKGNNRASIWYAPRVGVVRHEYKSDVVNYVKTLKEFKPGK